MKGQQKQEDHIKEQDLRKQLHRKLLSKSAQQNSILCGGKSQPGLVLRRKASEEVLSSQLHKPSPRFLQNKLLKSQKIDVQIMNKVKPRQVSAEQLSKEAKSILVQSRNRLKGELRPQDIFQFYVSFPEMLQDFFYLNRFSHPYDYRIVTYSQRNYRDYMTISSQGVTLYHDKEAQFLTREQWLAEEKLYYVLQRIYFFKHYKLCKNFCIWKNRMRRHYMKDMSSLLNERIFLTCFHPRNCLLKVSEICGLMQEQLELLPYATLVHLSLQEFKKISEQHLEQGIIHRMKQDVDNIVEHLQQAIAEVILKFKEENNIKIQGVHEREVGAKEGYIYSHEAILRKQYRRVHRLIRLADATLLEAKVNFFHHSMLQLLERINSLRGDGKDSWIVCEADLDSHGAVRWTPDATALAELFITTINTAVKRVSDTHFLMASLPIFDKYRAAELGQVRLQDSKTLLKQIVEESKFYPCLLGQIRQCLQSQFNCTKEKQEQLQPYVNIYLRHQEVGELQELYRCNTAVELSGFMDQWRKNEAVMAELPSNVKNGCLLFFKYDLLGQRIKTTPTLTIQSFLCALPDQTMTLCAKVISECKRLLEDICVYPSEIESFLVFNNAVRLAASRLQDIRSEGSQICLLVELMSRNKINNQQTYTARKNQVTSAIAVLKAKVDQSEARENESLSKFKKDNEVEVIKINANAKEVASKFYSVDFSGAKGTQKEAKEILVKIDQLLPAITALHSQAARIEHIERELGLPDIDFTEINQLFKTAELVNSIWKCRTEWKALIVEIYPKHYCDIDCGAVRAQWEEFALKTAQLSRQVTQSQVLKMLVAEIGEFELLLSTVLALRSPNLDQKSWHEISEYLAYEMGNQCEKDVPFSNPKNPAYTLQWLSSMNIQLYKEKIKFIVNKSEKERQITANLVDFRTLLLTLNFEVVPQQREVVLLGENRELRRTLEDKLAQLYSIVENLYSASIKAEAETLIKQYEYLEEILHAATDYGVKWGRYQSFFNSNSGCLKMLAKETKEFGNWEAQWKKIFKSITGQSAYLYKKLCDETAGYNCSRSLLRQIGKVNANLEIIRKGLEEYLEKKRSFFPRYFLFSDEQLLALFGSVNPNELIPNSIVPVLYRHIAEIRCRPNSKETVEAIVSKEGEQFQLKPVSFKLQSEMEEIFKQTEDQIRKRLNVLIKSVFLKYIEEEVTRECLFLENNTQVVLAVDYIAWVRLAEETYLCPQPLGDLSNWLTIQLGQIKQLRNLLAPSSCAHIRYKLLQLLSQSIYFREKTEYLMSHRVASLDTYEWERTPKLCLSLNSPEIYLKQFTAKLPYCYEFLGNASLSFVVPETERVWLGLLHAIANRDIVCLQGSNTYRVQTLKELSYVVAQSVESVQIGSFDCCKSIERYMCGTVFTGGWCMLNLPHTESIVTFVTAQLQVVRKAILEGSANVVLGRTNIGINPNCCFLLSQQKGKNYSTYFSSAAARHLRSINLSKPNLEQMLKGIAECEVNRPGLGSVTYSIVNKLQETFSQDLVKSLNTQFMLQVLRMVAARLVGTGQHKAIEELMVFEVLDGELLSFLSKENVKIYQSLKTSFLPDYEQLRAKVARELGWSTKKAHDNNTPLPTRSGSQLQSYLQQHNQQHYCTPQLLSQAECLQECIESSSLATIMTGNTLTGKSSLLTLVKEFIQQQSKSKIYLRKINVNAYFAGAIFSQSEHGIGLVPRYMADREHTNWLVLDGKVCKEYLDLFADSAEKYVLPQLGLYDPSSEHQLPHRIILETIDLSDVAPSIVANHAIVHFSQDNFTPDILVRSLFATLGSSGLLQQLSSETVNDLLTQFCSCLSKMENRNSFKSRSISFIYPPGNLQISYRSCRLVQNIFRMNWESIQEKEKQARKICQRFVPWVIFWALFGLVVHEDILKLEKYVLQVCHAEVLFDSELSTFIVYPACGLQVQPWNGLRTQSCLDIPENGILTNPLRTQSLTPESLSSTNKFYEEIVISDSQIIRVNCKSSGRFSYLCQLSAQSETPLLLVGPASTGKKSLIQLYAKNLRNRTQQQSIRFMAHRKYKLADQIEKPYRKIVGSQRVTLKSPLPSLKIFLSIQDVSLTTETKDSCELLRSICTEHGFWHQAQWLMLANIRMVFVANRVVADPEVSRLLPRLAVLQSHSHEEEQMQAIFEAYLKSWSSFNSIPAEVDRLFTSTNGDALIDATLSIYRTCQDFFSNSCLQKNSLERFLLKPRMGDVAKLLAYICKTPGPGTYNLTYYCELWAHEVLRVFGDRVRDSNLKEALIKQIKKQSLLKFKTNINLPSDSPFVFTNLGLEQDETYSRLEDLSFLHSYISELLKEQQISVPFQFLFGKLYEQVMRIHRVLSLNNGHIMLFAINGRTAEYLIQLTCQLGGCNYYRLYSQKLISVTKHVQPTIRRKESLCLAGHVDCLGEDLMYQMACLMNTNNYDFDLKGDMKEKLKGLLAKKEGVESGDKKEGKVMNNARTKNELLRGEQGLKEDELEILLVQSFMTYSHFALIANPACHSSQLFLQNNPGVVKNLVYNFIDMPEQALSRAATEVLTFDTNSSQPEINTADLVKKASLIFASLPASEQYFNDLLTICENTKMETCKILVGISARIDSLHKALANQKTALSVIKDNQAKNIIIQQELQKINEQQLQRRKVSEELARNIAQLHGDEQPAQLAALKRQEEEISCELLEIKELRDKAEAEKKKFIKTIKISYYYLEIFKEKDELVDFERLLQKEERKKETVQDIVLIFCSLLSTAGSKGIETWISLANQWAELIHANIPKFNNANELLECFKLILDTDINGWQVLSAGLQFKLRTMVYHLTNYQQSVNCSEILRIYDPHLLLEFLLQRVNQENESICLNILKKYEGLSRQNFGEIEVLLRAKSKRGLILINSNKEEQIEELEEYLKDRKMLSCLNRFLVVLTVVKPSMVYSIECDQEYFTLHLKTVAAKIVHGSKQDEMELLRRQLYKEVAKKSIVDKQFLSSCAQINFSSETYSQQIYKLKQSSDALSQSIANYRAELKSKSLVSVDFEIIERIAFEVFVNGLPNEFTLKTAEVIYNDVRKGSEQEKDRDSCIKNLIACNFGEVSSLDIVTLMSHLHLYRGTISVLQLPSTNLSLEYCEKILKLKPLNLLSSQFWNVLGSDQPDSNRVLVNYISDLHQQVLGQFLKKCQAENKRAYVVMLGSSQLDIKSVARAIVIKSIEDRAGLSNGQLEIVDSSNSELDSLMKILKQYLQSQAKDEQQLAQSQMLLDSIGKNVAILRTKQGFIELVFDLYQSEDQKLLKKTLTGAIPIGKALEAIAAKDSASEDIPRGDQTVFANDLEMTMEELPFSFNLGEINPSKDPLALELLLRCERYNHKLKIIKDRLQQMISDSDCLAVRPSSACPPPQQDIEHLNLQCNVLRKCLVKLQVLPNNIGPASSRNNLEASPTSLAMSNLLVLGKMPLSNKLLSCIKYRACKKLKCNINCVKLMWKVWNAKMMPQDIGTSAQLCVLITGRIKGWRNILVASTSPRPLEYISLLVFPVQVSLDSKFHDEKTQQKKNHEGKTATMSLPQTEYVSIPIFSTLGNLLDSLQLPQSEVSSRFSLQLDRPQVIVAFDSEA